LCHALLSVYACFFCCSFPCARPIPHLVRNKIIADTHTNTHTHAHTHTREHAHTHNITICMLHLSHSFYEWSLQENKHSITSCKQANLTFYLCGPRKRTSTALQAASKRIAHSICVVLAREQTQHYKLQASGSHILIVGVLQENEHSITSCKQAGLTLYLCCPCKRTNTALQAASKRISHFI
jgi:hypothetical protein